MRIIEGLKDARASLVDRVFADRPQPEEAVRQIISAVRTEGDAALLRYTKELDGAELSQIEATPDEIARSRNEVDPGLLSALELAAGRIQAFHTRQRARLGLGFEREGLGFLVRPIERAGIYVPGGTASYPSTVLMTAIPARVAGVEEIIVCTPPGPDGAVPPATLAAAGIAGVDRVFKAGGAQAVAAMAYGTKTVPMVDKICGPGNVYVTLAKKQVFGTVAIDGLHGPTETVILADDSANPVFCAADLLAQAEHDEMATAVLVTTSQRLAQAVDAEVESQLASLERREIARKALDDNGALVVLGGMEEALELVNALAPEHLCLAVENARSYLDRIRHAGGIFIESPETLGDYTAGPSHVMPTGRTARFGSPLSVLDFLKISILVDLDDAALKALGPAAAAIARAEGLTAHALSVEKRLDELGEGGQ
jgi:histidinol dehydrogenase